MTGIEFPFALDDTAIAEADDLFGWYTYNLPDRCVIYTQDKDMRMLPGMHLDWVSHRTYTVPYTKTVCIEREFMYNIVPTDCIFNEKQYGHKWFWLQMLHGDTADNIPGLPKATMKYGGGPIVTTQKLNPVGETGASKMLEAHSDMAIKDVVAMAYRSYYGDRWLVEMMEQACLLWMRRVPEHWDDCMNSGGPLAYFNDGEQEFAKAYLEIEGRVRDADNINSAAAEVNADSRGTTGASNSTA
jgi:DNA polymerase-1